jgi:DnaK suppressor protein
MSDRDLRRFRRKLLEMRARVASGVEHVSDALQEDINQNANESRVPVHLADVAPRAMEAEVRVLEMEQNQLSEIDEALRAIDEGTYGRCEECERPISDERLDALPFAQLCIECARNAQPVDQLRYEPKSW